MVEFECEYAIRLLVVDEDPVKSIELAETFEQAGFDVAVCGTAFDAINMLEMEPDVDAVVVNVRPANGGRGWNLATAIRARIANKPMIYMAEALQGDYAARGVSGSVILQQPVAARTIVASIIELLWRGKGGAPRGEQLAATFKAPLTRRRQLTEDR